MLLESLLDVGINCLLDACWERFFPRRCPHCGEPLKERDSGQIGHYCPHCGRKVRRTERRLE